MGEHRWQGYSHHELFAQIHEGPGPDGSTESVRRWSELTRALGEIDNGLAAAVRSAMAAWQGDAADSARDGLRPLGDWATQAQEAAAVMRERAEQQAQFIAKARSDMPPPVRVTTEDPGTAATLLTHLFGGQTDYELQEAEQNAAEQRAFDVMRTYEASTRSNTTSLASFSPPPQVVVDAPVTGHGGAATQRPVTISWGAAPAPVPPVAAPGGGGAQGAAARGESRGSRGDSRGSRGGAAARRDGGRLAASSRRPLRDRDAESVNRQVTEEIGGSGGFFDEPQTLARPVIGGEPGA
ncbi:PPE domain-containing protein [Saccharopolyspora rosea]|uniref:PPE domain-containing protein n=1 Tax=Saccharopolyspora rosea TaxID=524884 RepID=UPI0021D926F9|nr:PPE domain-containing protein [Saccharopolyspora rosea]